MFAHAQEMTYYVRAEYAVSAPGKLPTHTTHTSSLATHRCADEIEFQIQHDVIYFSKEK